MCKKKLTIGVLNRVNQLADRKYGTQPKNIIPFKNVVPLQEIISESFGVGKQSKKVQTEYESLVAKGGTEFGVLLDLSYTELLKITQPEIALAIKNVREDKVKPIAGYDGVYGIVKVFNEGQLKKPTQKSLI